MRKFISIVFLIVGILMCFSSCKEEAGTATMKLILKKNNVGAKTLVPNNTSSLQITKYRVQGTGPNNGTFNVNTDSTSVSINGLEVGTWNVTAKGMNAAGEELVQGSTEYQLSQNSGAATINLNQMIGTGTLSVSIDWTNTEVPDPNLSVFLTPQGGTESALSPTIDYENRTCQVSESLASGSYVIRGVLKSGDFHVGGFADTVRIVNGQTTTGSISISQMQFADASGYFLMVNNAGEPVRGNVTGFTLDSDSSYTLAANTEKIIKFNLDREFEESPGLKIQWFLDGVAIKEAEALGTENEIAINTTPGSHRLDAVVSNNLLGSFGCASTSFLSMISGTSGALSKLSDFSTLLIGKNGSECTYLQLSNDTIVSPLPAGRFLVISPSNQKIVVMKVVRNYLDLVSVYSTSDFDFIGNITQVASDSILPWIVTVDNKGGTENITFFKFNQNDGSISMIGGSAGRKIGVLPVASSVNITLGDVFALGLSNAGNRVYIGDNAAKLGTATKPRLMWIEVSDSAATLKGTGDISGVMTDCNSMSISPSGSYIALTSSQSTSVAVGRIASSGGIAEWKKINQTATVPEDVLMSSDRCVTATNGCIENFIVNYSGISSPASITPSTLAIQSDQLIMNQHGTFLYALDSTNRDIYSISRSSVDELTQIGLCKITNNSSVVISSIAMAGSYLLAVASNGSLSLCRVLE